MYLRWFLRMAKWSHHPPGWRRVVLVLSVIALCLLIYGIQKFIGWPAWATVSGSPRGRLPRF